MMTVMKPIAVRTFLAALLLAATSLAGAQEQAFTNRATELRERPDAGAKVLSSLPDNTAVKVLSRSGGWTQVESGGSKGWVRVFHLKFPAAVESSSSGGGGLSGLTSALGFGKSRQERANIASVGIRGLSEEELKNANPDPEALKKLMSFRADKAGAERFAREAKLVAQNVPYPDSGKSMR